MVCPRSSFCTVRQLMGALNEVLDVRQTRNEPRRRWFRSDGLDLIAWCDESGRPRGFQLCYDRPRRKRALTRLPELGFLHAAVDDGEDVGYRHRQSPKSQSPSS